MEFRKYQLWDEQQIQKIHYNSIHSLDCYSELQKDTLSPLVPNIDEWKQSLLNTNAFVAIENWNIVGFWDIKNNGYLKRLYVDPNFFWNKIWETLLNILESQAQKLWISEITLDATVSSGWFYQKYWYEIVEDKIIHLQWEKFNVYFMRKKI